MIITEEEREEILSKYSDDTSDELLNHLKRNFEVYEVKTEWMEKPLKFIQIDGKSRVMDSNKKYLVGRIFSEVEELWRSLGTQKIRRTIKKYLDGVR